MVTNCRLMTLKSHRSVLLGGACMINDYDKPRLHVALY